MFVCSLFFRRIDGGYSGTASARHVKSLPQHEQKSHHETASPDKNDEGFQETRRRFLLKSTYNIICIT